MAWDRFVANFGDPAARVKELPGQRIEILYGGSAGNSRDDGHGHVVARNIDGLFQFVYHRLPQSQGGYIIVNEEDPRDAYSGRTRDQLRAAQQKQHLIDQAQRLTYGADTRVMAATIRQLREDFRAVGNAGRDDRVLREEFESHAKKIHERVVEERARQAAERERKKKEWEARQVEKARKQKEWDARQAERERKKKEWEARQVEKAAKQKEWEARQVERARKHKEWEALQAARKAEQARKQQEWEARQAQRRAQQEQSQREYEARQAARRSQPRSGGQARSIFDPFAPAKKSKKTGWF